MYLSMDATGFILRANYPYPNLECKITFKCSLDSSISTEIIAVTYDAANTWPYFSSGPVLI
jgi:hypothetical protein